MKLADLKGKTVGVCVSGGLDSKTICCVLQDAGVKVKAFSANVGQPDEKDINDIVELIDTVLSAVAKYADVVNGVTEEGAEEYKAVLENVKRKVHNLTAGRPLNNY